MNAFVVQHVVVVAHVFRLRPLLWAFENHCLTGSLEKYSYAVIQKVSRGSQGNSTEPSSPGNCTPRALKRTSARHMLAQNKRTTVYCFALHYNTAGVSPLKTLREYFSARSDAAASELSDSLNEVHFIE
jgi:hypothetical protein